MKSRIFLSIAFLSLSLFAISQEYVANTYLGLRRNFGSINNGYTNGVLKESNEKVGFNIIEFSTEGMDKNFFIRFNTDFFGVLPDYMFKALNKKNTATVHGESLDNFRKEYNQTERQYEYNASFSDWDVLAGNISYGYKYFFAGGNFAWSFTGLKAYQSVTNIKIIGQAPPDFYSFNTDGNFSYGLNVVGGNNNPVKPIRLIIAYDWLLMRDYYEKWHGDKGTRLSFDLQGNWPEKFNKDKWGLYAALTYRMYDVDYIVSVNGLESTQVFHGSLMSVRAGISW